MVKRLSCVQMDSQQSNSQHVLSKETLIYHEISTASFSSTRSNAAFSTPFSRFQCKAFSITMQRITCAPHAMFLADLKLKQQMALGVMSLSEITTLEDIHLQDMNDFGPHSSGRAISVSRPSVAFAVISLHSRNECSVVRTFIDSKGESGRKWRERSASQWMVLGWHWLALVSKTHTIIMQLQECVSSNSVQIMLVCMWMAKMAHVDAN